MSTVRTYSRNLATCWLAEGAAILVAFFLMPFIIRKLGDVRYGAWSLLLCLSGWLTLVDVGLRQGISKHLNEYLARRDDKRASELVTTAMVMMAGAGLVVILLALVSGGFFGTIFPSLPRDYFVETWIAMALVGLNIAVGLQSSLFRRVLEAFNRIDQTNTVGMLNLGIRTAITVAVLACGGGLIGLAFAMLAGTAVDAFAMRVLAPRVWPGMHIGREFVKKAEAGILVRFGIPVLLGNIAGTLTGYTNIILVGVFIGVAEVTAYSIAFMLITYSGQFLRQILRVLTPDLYKYAGIDDKAALRHLYVRTANVTAFAGLPLFVCLLFFGEEFIRLWLHRDPGDTARVLTILTVGSFSMLTGGVGGVIMVGLGQVRLSTLLTVLQGVGSLAATLIFIKVFRFGLPGVALGSMIFSLAVSGVLQPIIVCRHIKLTPGAFLTHALLRWCLAGGLFAAACCAVARLAPTDGWPTFAAKVLALGIVYVPIGWYTLLDQGQRHAVLAKTSTARARERTPCNEDDLP
jgi:O-antigen/teichoic acid export membrane protein